MKKLTFFLAVVAFLALSLSANAQVTVVDSGYCGGVGDGKNLTWKLTNDNTLTISGSGAMDDYDAYNYPFNYPPWDSYCNTIGTVVIDSGVTSIGVGAFSDCGNLISATLPNSVVIIGKGAFYNCRRLNAVNLPDSLISIGDVAFYGCYRLSSVTIPQSVTFIGDRVYGGCRILSSINVDSNNQCYSSINGIVYNKLQDTLIFSPQAKGGYVAIPNSVTVIGDNAFSYCENLISVTIPNSVVTIGDNAFYACNYLSSVSIGNSVATIGDWAFSGCGSLSFVIIPNSVITIGKGAFSFCFDLIYVSIGNSVTTIGNDAFVGCGFTSITIPNSVASIGDWAFNSHYLTSVICNAIIPPALGDYVFYDVYANINIPIYIPCFTYNSYRNASGWDQYSNFIINGHVDTTFYDYTKCYGVPYTDDNFTTPIDSAGVYYATLANSSGCDSVICLTLEEYPQTLVTNYLKGICEGEVYNDANFTNLTQAGTYYDTLQTVNGCDSIIELILTVNPKQDTVIFSDTIYYGGNYTQNGFNIINATTDSIYFNNNLNINNCDSVTQLILKIIGVGIVETHCNASLLVYPNPTTGQLTIDCRDVINHVSTVEIFDVVGRNVGANLRVRPDGVIIDISHLPAGMYFLKIGNNIVKFVKE